MITTITNKGYRISFYPNIRQVSVERKGRWGWKTLLYVPYEKWKEWNRTFEKIENEEGKHIG